MVSIFEWYKKPVKEREQISNKAKAHIDLNNPKSAHDLIMEAFDMMEGDEYL